MCGRFVQFQPLEVLEEVFEAEVIDDHDPGPNYNVCPTQQIPVVVTHAQKRVIARMRWGFVPHWYTKPTDGPLLINARAETLAEKPAFRAACRSRRCLIPADGFYEWAASAGKGKEPWYIYPKDKATLAFAAVWQAWTSPDGQRQVTTAIVTTKANKALEAVHHRMPVIVSPQDWPLWLGQQGPGASALMRPAADNLLDLHKISTVVNNMAAQGAELRNPR